jgi:hypothetical protein
MLSLYHRNLRTVTLLVGALMLLTGALACNLPIGPTVEPTSPPPPPPPPPPEPTQEVTGESQPTSESPEALPNVTYEGISFSYDETLADEAVGETAPAEDFMAGEAIPAHVQFSFQGYPLSGIFHEPRIHIYPVNEFEASSQAAASIIAEQRRFLVDRPATPESIPFLPLFNAAQLMRTQVEYIDFQSGSGVRFLTEYAQYFAPINNTDLFYTFQGLTDDGAYYVAAILPVSNSILPADASAIPGGDPDAFANNYDSYVTDIQQQLDEQSPSDFTPDLALLDAMIQSLKIE